MRLKAPDPRVSVLLFGLYVLPDKQELRAGLCLAESSVHSELRGLEFGRKVQVESNILGIRVEHTEGVTHLYKCSAL